MKSSKKYFLYVRKSTDDSEHQVMSLDSQINELRAFAAREDIVIREIIEESKTAKQPGRPRFNEMLNRIEAGEANGLLCWDVDRLYRNPIDEGRVRWLLQKGGIASIRTPTREFLPDDAGLLMGVEGGRAADYIIRLARNVQRGRREKLRRGEWPGGQKPLGYIYDHRLRNIVPDPKRAPLLQKAFEDFATGRFGLSAIADRLFAHGVVTRGGRPLSKHAVGAFLTNRLYIGVMEWKGEVYEGKYKPLVTIELFDHVQRALRVRSKPRNTRKGHNFPFCGLFRCSCGSMMTAQWARGRHGGLYRYYRCTRKAGACSEPYIQENRVSQSCLELLKPIALTSEEARTVHALIDEAALEDSRSLDTEIKAAQEKLSALQAKLDRLTRGYLDEVIDEDSYRRAKEELVTEKTAQKREKERLSKSRSSYWIEPSREVVNTLETLGKTETANNLPEIARLVQKIGTNPLISRKTVTFSFVPLYDFVPSLLASLRLAPTPSTKSQSGDESQSSNWRPHGESNPDLELEKLPS